MKKMENFLEDYNYTPKKKDFSEIIKKLRKYYKNKKLLDFKKFEIQLINTQIANLQANIKEFNLVIDTDIKGIDYSRQKISSSSINSLDNKLIIAIEKAEKEISNKEKAIFIITQEIFSIEIEIEFMEKIINSFTDVAKDYIKYKYKEGMTNKEISFKLSMSEASLSRLSKDILFNLEFLENI